MNRAKVISRIIIESLVIVLWTISFYGTIANYYTYILIALLSVAALIYNVRHGARLSKNSVCKIGQSGNHDKRIRSCVVTSIIVSLIITLGHYYLYTHGNGTILILRAAIMSVGGAVVFFELLSFASLKLVDAHLSVISSGDRCGSGLSRATVYIVSAAIFFVCYIIYLVLSRYPAGVQYDTMVQLNEIYTSSYTNHHPVIMTWMIELWLRIAAGLGLSHTVGLFMYTVMQVLCISLVVGYMFMTLYEIGIKRGLIIAIYIIFLIYPINMVFVPYVQKDGPFAYATLLMIVSLYRIVAGIGSHARLDYVWLIIGTALVILLRSNGTLVVICTFIAFIIIDTSRDKKRICICIAITLALGILFKSVGLTLLGVRSTEFSEGLSIPIQQIGRVVYDGEELTRDEAAMIEHLIDLDSIRYTNPYDPHCSDNIKGMIQYNGRDSYLEEHKTDYLKLWIELGLKYPITYIEAYIDETMGYYIPGFGDLPLESGYCEIAPEYDIYPLVISESATHVFNLYLSLFEEGRILHSLSECGLYIYILLYTFIIALWKHNTASVHAVPAIANVISLYLTTPLYGNQRYLCMLYVTLPFVLIAVYLDSGDRN